jgi:hypothetical protein
VSQTGQEASSTAATSAAARARVPDEPKPLLGGAGRVLALLFPQAPATRRSWTLTVWLVLANVAAVAVGALVLLLRQTGRPAWDTVGNEDSKYFLSAAIAHPLRSLSFSYNGYLEIVPRLIAEVVARLPFRDADVGFAVAGAVTASACAVFVFHASAGHIRRPALRAVLALSVLLLPTALYEISNSGVNTPWYLLFALFWALLWRPRTVAGKVVAGLVCFLAVGSNPLAIAYLPLIVARVIALPRVREHAATLGFLLGAAVQAPSILNGQRNYQHPPLAGALGFWARNVILAGVAGHHWAAVLTSAVGIVAATLLAGFAVAVVIAWASARGGGYAAAFAVAALVTGFLLTMLPVELHGLVASPGEPRTLVYVHGSRYAQGPILILYSFFFVAADAVLSRAAAGSRRTVQAVVAVVAMIAVLGTVWVSDYRFVNRRATEAAWSVTVSRVQAECAAHRPVKAPGLPWNFRCSMVRR